MIYSFNVTVKIIYAHNSMKSFNSGSNIGLYLSSNYFFLNRATDKCDFHTLSFQQRKLHYVNECRLMQFEALYTMVVQLNYSTGKLVHDVTLIACACKKINMYTLFVVILICFDIFRYAT